MTAPAPKFSSWAESDPLDPAHFEPRCRELQERKLDSAAALEQWLLDFSSWWAEVDEAKSRRYVEHSCHTDDEEIERAYLHVVETIDPLLKPLFFSLQKKLVECPFKSELPAERFEVLVRRWQADVELYHPANIPLETEEAKKVSEYDKISGQMTVVFQGEELPLPRMAKFSEDSDRAVREAAWRAVQERRTQDADRLEDIFDELLSLRSRIAAQAGLPDYRAYVWKQTKRFDYTPADCGRFAETVEKHVTPVLKELHARRKRQLGLDVLRPWDLAVDPTGLPPLVPFEPHDIPKLVSGAVIAFDAVSEQLGDSFRELELGRNLDLDSRKGKAPGGYQAAFEASREPFIFMNSAGLHSDVITLLHEAGHAFHFQAARDEPIVFLRSAPLEFCEVASMAMEWIAAPHLASFYDAADVDRAREMLADRVVGLFPWIAVVDSYQHWIYTHPGHTRDERSAAWLGLHERFFGSVDWSGLESYRRREWLRQLHLFHYPFYYIEYGIAQLGALGVWRRAEADPEAAVSSYRRGLALGGKRPLPELFAAAGVSFDWSDPVWPPLVSALRRVLKLT